MIQIGTYPGDWHLCPLSPPQHLQLQKRRPGQPMFSCQPLRLSRFVSIHTLPLIPAIPAIPFSSQNECTLKGLFLMKPLKKFVVSMPKERSKNVSGDMPPSLAKLLAIMPHSAAELARCGHPRNTIPCVAVKIGNGCGRSVWFEDCRKT